MKVVVDASNVAYNVKNENGQPQMSNILAAVKALEESEDEFVIIADASLCHDIDDKQKYLKLLESENVEDVPATCAEYFQYVPYFHQENCCPILLL